MAKNRYEMSKVVRTVKELLRLVFARQNILYPLFLIPLLILTVVSNKMDVESSKIFDSLIKKTGEGTIRKYITLWATAKLINTLVTAAFDILISRFYSTTRNIALRDYLSLDWNDYRKYSVGALSLRHFEKGESASVILYTIFPELFDNTAYFILGVRKVGKDGSSIASWCLIASVALHLLIFILMIGKYNQYQKDYTDSKVLISSKVANEVSNYDIIKTYNLSDASVDRIRKANAVRRNTKIKMSIFSGKMNLGYSLIQSLALLVLFVLAIYGYQVGSLSLVFALGTEIHKKLGSFLKNITKANESFYTFYMLHDDIKPSEEPEEAVAEIEEIEAKDLSFLNVFNKLNFKIKKGERIAIVGENGSGRTVLIKSMIGFIPYEGQLLVNDKDLRSIRKSSVREQITVVSQTESYTQGTIMRNLKYGNNLSEEEVIQKCKEWGVHGIIESIDGMYEKYSSTGGSELSGGQKQRIALMRAILRNRPVLLVDDALSGISTSDRNELIDKILSQEDKTIVMVLKSPQFLDRFDKVIMLDKNECRFDTVENIKPYLGRCFSSEI